MAVAAKKRPSKTTEPKNAKPNVVAAARGKGKTPGQSPVRALWEFIKSISGVLVIFLVIRTFFVEAYRIPSGSMIPALQVGDWLFVNKLVYGPHIPFTSINLPGYAEPKRGDIVVFQSPPQIDQPEDPTPTLVKRLVGVGGDTLHMRAGVLYVNGIAQRQGYAASVNPSGVDDISDLFEWQKRYNLKASRFGAAPAQPSHDNWGPLVVPAGYLMMLGDNRYCSKDSRYWGLVPRENVRGRPIFVYYSFRPGDGDACSPDISDRALPFITDIRWGRIGHRIK
jgi:signal peptidase I